MRKFSVRGQARHVALAGAPLASFGARAGAFFFDVLVVALMVTVFGLPGVIRAAKHSAAFHVGIPFEPFDGLWGLAAMVAYFGITTYFGRGKTLGKRLFRIRVVSLVQDELTLWQCIERAVGYGASAVEGGFGFLQYFLHANRQTVHDRIAETVVVAASAQDTRAAQQGDEADEA